MKIALAQIQSSPGNLTSNWKRHSEMIDKAINEKCELIVFPELSLSGYEPTLAKQIIKADLSILKEIKKVSMEKDISICFGLPTESKKGIHISAILNHPDGSMDIYSKEHLHKDEIAYFQPGDSNQLFISGNVKAGFAICYEISIDEYMEQIADLSPSLFIASVSKDSVGLSKAKSRLAQLAKKYKWTVFMVNNIGPADNFIAAGGSFIINSEGKIIDELSSDQEGILCYEIIE